MDHTRMVFRTKLRASGKAVMALSAGLGMTAFFLFSPASARAGVIPAQE